MAKIILIDLNSVGYASQDSTKLLANGGQTQAIYNSIRTVRSIVKNNPDFRVLLLDDGKAQWRYDLFPMYKGNRNIDPKRVAEKEAYKVQKPAIIKGLSSLGVDYIRSNTCEADDLAGFFVSQLSANENNEILMVTSDRDWTQLVRKNVLWYCPRFERKCDMENFKEFTGCATPEQLVEIKAMMGDSSDNIPGVGGVGEVAAKAIVEKYGSVFEFLRQYDAGELKEGLPKNLQLLADNGVPKASSKYGVMSPTRNALERNYKLMNLLDKTENPFVKEQSEKITGKLDLKEFEVFCEEYNFNSMLNNFEDFVKPFVNLGASK